MIVVVKMIRFVCCYFFGCLFNMVCLFFLLLGGCLFCVMVWWNGLLCSGVFFGWFGIFGVDFFFECLYELV